MMFNDYTKVCIRSVIAAGELIEKYKDTKLRVTSKESHRDIVTQLDLAAEKLIIDEINNVFSNQNFIAEESGIQKNNKTSRYWIIDPLDGTTNLVHGLPMYGVSVAYCENGKIVSGAIYLPSSKDLYFAEFSKGAFKNYSRLKSGQENLEQGLAIITLPGKISSMQKSISVHEEIREINEKSRGILRLGSSVYALALAAEGKIGSIYGYEAQPWDVSAGLLLNFEAGNNVSIDVTQFECVKSDYQINVQKTQKKKL